MSKQTRKKRRLKYNKGALGAGMAYAILCLLVIIAAGALMVGSIFPKDTFQNGQPVIISTNTPEPGKNNLQLYDFKGATYTPTPTDTPTPTPTDVPHSSGGGGGGGSTCFPAGTKVLMADMTQKNIEHVTVGDHVMGYDVKNKILSAETVLQMESPIRDHLYKLVFAGGLTLELTREHPLYTSNGWKSIAPAATAAENPNLKVGKLTIGDQVLTSGGSFAAIRSMQYIPGHVQTYNLKSVTGYNDFFVNGFLAHNKGGGGGGGSGVGSLPLD